jgi:hypothetical protein
VVVRHAAYILSHLQNRWDIRRHGGRIKKAFLLVENNLIQDLQKDIENPMASNSASPLLIPNPKARGDALLSLLAAD